MHLFLRDPTYTHRLAGFLASLGKHAVVSGPDALQVADHADEASRLELEIYLGVWGVLYPDAEVELAA